MLPDLRFVLGASLAIAMLAVAGLGLAISTELLHEARVNPIESTQSLAYAGQAEDNPFYDPNSVLRFAKELAKPDENALALRVAKAPEPNPASPAASEEPITTVSHLIEANVAGETSVASPPARAVAPDAADRPTHQEGIKPPESPPAAEASPPAEPERLANALGTAPAADNRKEEESPPPDGIAAESAPATPAAKPVHHRPRPKFARTPHLNEQEFQYQGFLTGNAQQWSRYDSPWGTPPAAKKKTGTVAPK